MRDAAAADAVVTAVKAAGHRAVALQGDMAKEDDVARVFAAVDRELGRLPIWSTRRASPARPRALEVADAQMMREVIDLNRWVRCSA
ncbi:MAG: hypothetical protein M5U07_20855 [Xanthobacteraceae bacterium]|nr:hypothetical protein [Xanthobacteraceae bacterium]